MAVNYISLPLYPDSFYSYTTSLENQNYKFEMLWNERANFWAFNLYLEDNTPIVLGQRMVPNYPLLSEYSLNGLTGFLYLVPNSEINSEQYITYARQLDQYYSLFYIYNSD